MSTTRAVRVVTEVAALDRPFDYARGTGMDDLGVGDRVRVNLHGRSVRGWVWSFVESDLAAKPISRWLGLGFAPSMEPILTWSARRWCGPLARFLLAASPDHVVRDLPVTPARVELEPSVRAVELVSAPGVVQLAPTYDPLGLVLHAYETVRTRPGSLLVLVPNDSWSRRLGGRLAQRGVPVAFAGQWERARADWPVVIGARGVAFAPVGRVAGAVVIDADDESYRSEAAPTWHAIDVVRERCREVAAPYWFTSPLPSPSLRHGGDVVTVAPDERARWPQVEVVDRRHADPRDGALAAPALAAARRALDGDEPVAVVVVLQRLGSGRLFACATCGELARCERCTMAEIEDGGMLRCTSHDEVREMFCRACGSTKLRRVRSGVTTLARDVAAQLSQPVTEVTAATQLDLDTHRVVVGTEAVWQRVRRAGVVIFADFDQYLLAPRERSRRDAVLAVAKAGRLVGARRDGRGRVIVQTRRGDDEVLRALRDVDFAELCENDDETARHLGLPPFGATATLSGEAAAQFAAAVASDEVSVRESTEGFVLHATTVAVLTDRLAQVPRPPGRLRVAVN